MIVGAGRYMNQVRLGLGLGYTPQLPVSDLNISWSWAGERSVVPKLARLPPAPCPYKRVRV